MPQHTRLCRRYRHGCRNARREFIVGKFFQPTYATCASLSNVIDNFGIEAWVKPRNGVTGSHIIAYYGNPDSSGWGLRVNNGAYQILFGGVIFTPGAGSATNGVWTHVALVRNNGVANCYVNGLSVANTGSAPSPPVGSFAVASVPGGGGTNWWDGEIDEVRFFTFTAGQFSTNDLLLNAGPPSTTAVQAGGVTGSSATLYGLVNPSGLSTTWSFQCGTTTNYGATSGGQTLVPSSCFQPVSINPSEYSN